MFYNASGCTVSFQLQRLEGEQHTIKLEEVRSHQQLEADLDRDVHVRNVLLAGVLNGVVEVFCDLLEDDATVLPSAYMSFPLYKQDF